VTLLCDSCGEAIEEQTRPEAFVPLANEGGIDLCWDCKQALANLLGVEVEEVPT